MHASCLHTHTFTLAKVLGSLNKKDILLYATTGQDKVVGLSDDACAIFFETDPNYRTAEVVIGLYTGACCCYNTLLCFL